MILLVWKICIVLFNGASLKRNNYFYFLWILRIKSILWPLLINNLWKLSFYYREQYSARLYIISLVCMSDQILCTCSECTPSLTTNSFLWCSKRWSIFYFSISSRSLRQHLLYSSCWFSNSCLLCWFFISILLSIFWQSNTQLILPIINTKCYTTSFMINVLQ